MLGCVCMKVAVWEYALALLTRGSERSDRRMLRQLSCSCGSRHCLRDHQLELRDRLRLIGPCLPAITHTHTDTEISHTLTGNLWSCSQSLCSLYKHSPCPLCNLLLWWPVCPLGAGSQLSSLCVDSDWWVEATVHTSVACLSLRRSEANRRDKTSTFVKLFTKKKNLQESFSCLSWWERGVWAEICATRNWIWEVTSRTEFNLFIFFIYLFWKCIWPT